MSRILIISLDGATWRVFHPLIEDGTMSFLGGIVERGSHGVLESVIPPVTAPAWSSFMTGKLPDKHGVYEFRCFDIKDRKDYITNASYIRSETIWQILSRHNKRIISINVPYTYPVYEINGIMISGMDTPSADSDYCYPQSLKEIIRKRFPDYVPVMKAWDMKDVENDTKAIKYIEELLELIDTRVKLSIFLLHEYNWDLAMVHFQETDYIQHLLWDRIMRMVRGRQSDPLCREIKKFYRKIDGYLQKIIEDFGTDINLFIISDHGCTTHKGVIYPNMIFERKGLLKRKGAVSLIQMFKEVIRKSENPLIKGLYRLQRDVRGKHKRTGNNLTVKEKLRIQQSIEILPVKWDRSQAVMVMGSQYAFIHIKDGGERRCKDILLNMRDERSNTPLFKDVVTINEAYGRETDRSDILVAIAEDGYSVSRRFKEDFLGRPFYPGIHHPEGIFVAYGVDMVKGGTDRLKLIDIVPTCLRLLELPLIEDMDGKIAYSIIKKDRTDRYDKSVYIEHDKRTYTEDDKRLIEERLRALGYI